MVDHARARRLAVRIRQITAATLEREVKDPRLAMVTVTDARVTPDLREATVYYTVFGDDTDRQGSAIALESARGVVRSAVGRALGVRYTPSIAFIEDVVPERAGRLEELLEKAREADAGLAAVRVGAEPAGDPDPYRVPRVRDEEPEDAEVEPGPVEPVAPDRP
ncbi:MAG TPA: 30S ribosome-binding factor RbfA [Frankiaceae bacterium]